MTQEYHQAPKEMAARKEVLTEAEESLQGKQGTKWAPWHLCKVPPLPRCLQAYTEHAATSSSQSCAAKEKADWSWTGCGDFTESPGETLDNGSLSTCLPSTCQLASQNPLSKEVFLMEFCTLLTMTYCCDNSNKKIHITTSTHKTYSN